MGPDATALTGLGRRTASAPGAGTSLLRFVTCGSVDDGKSTLIGRLLHEAGGVFDDQLDELDADSRRSGTRPGELDYALLLDGLDAEREQGITIDVAYRYFSTPRRSFIVADVPGHDQYTRNMVTGASTADLALVLVDARRGVVTQTRRHTFLAALLGIRHLVLAVNKLDLVGYSRPVFDDIEAEYRAFAGRLGIADVICIPVSATGGDNVSEPSGRTRWYRGPALVTHLEEVEVGASVDGPLRLPVQWVIRPDQDFRGVAGTVVRGSISRGAAVRVVPGGRTATVARVLVGGVDTDGAVAGQAVTVTLDEPVDVGRGDVLAAADDPPETADRFEAHVVWMHEDPMLPGRPYLLKIGAVTVGVAFDQPKYRVDVDTLEHAASRTLALNEIGVCNLHVDRPIPFDPYRVNRDMGGFIVIDRLTRATVGAGMLHFALRRSHNVHWQAVDVDAAAHARLKGHPPAAVWFTGLSGAGKSTIANLVERELHARGVHTTLLDGDNIRHGLNRDLGFAAADRVENIRRVAEVAKLMVDAGLVVLVSFISPFQAERRMARELIGDGRFVEVFVDAPLAIAEARDVKGLYGKARRGELVNFTGIDSPYERPERPDVHLDTTSLTAEAAASRVVDHLRSRGMVP